MKNTAKRNMSSAVYALSMYSCLCIKMSSFLSVCTWEMPHTSYLSCGIPGLGGWMGEWVVGSTGNKANSAPLEIELWLSLAILPNLLSVVLESG